VREFEEGKFLVMATKLGQIKKCDLTDFANTRRPRPYRRLISKDRACLASCAEKYFLFPSVQLASHKLGLRVQAYRDDGRGAVCWQNPSNRIF